MQSRPARAALGTFLGALIWSADLMASRLPQYAGRLQQVHDQIQGSLGSYGLSLPDLGGDMGSGIAKTVLHAVYGSVSLVLLILALTILGLEKVGSFRAKAEHAFRDPQHGRDLLASARAITEKFQSYLWARTIAAILQGITVALLSWILGLDLALVWGLLAFLLNYIPTLGSVLAVLPPEVTGRHREHARPVWIGPERPS